MISCDNPRRVSCNTCSNSLCASCTVQISRVLMCNREPSEFEVCMKCPFCNLKATISTFGRFEAGRPSLFKELLCDANVHTHKLPNFCTGCNKDDAVIVDHTPCGRGCYDCAESSIEWIIKSE